MEHNPELWIMFHCSPQANNYAGLLREMGLRRDAITARVRSAIKGEPEESA